MNEVWTKSAHLFMFNEQIPLFFIRRFYMFPTWNTYFLIFYSILSLSQYLGLFHLRSYFLVPFLYVFLPYLNRKLS